MNKLDELHEEHVKQSKLVMQKEHYVNLTKLLNMQEDISEETLNRYKLVLDTYKKLRNEIESLIDIEMKSHSTYYYQKKGIGSVSLNNVKNPELRNKLGLDTILRIYEKMISR